MLLSGCQEYPALLIYENGGQSPIDVYPHIRTKVIILEKDRIATIQKYLVPLYRRLAVSTRRRQL